MNKTGQARTDIEILDLSVIRNTGVKGIIGVLGVTERGPIGEPVLIGSWLQYTKTFGGLLSDNIFPLLCRRALEAGAKLRISRIGHYTTITDKTTLQGVIASVTQSGVTFKAKNLGTWGNSLSIKVEDNSAVRTGTSKVTFELTGYPDMTEVYIVPTANTSTDFSEIRTKSNLIGEITKTGTTSLAVVAKTSFTGGTNPTSYTTTDFIGDTVAENGLHAFDKVSDITKISAPSIADPTFDTAIIAYADSRKDLMAVIRTPVGLNSTAIIDYRNGTGSYSHTAHDSWRAIMVTGGLKINHPTTGEVTEIPELADVLGCMSRKDNEYAEWFTFAGPKRGLVKNNLGVVYNLGVASRQLEADSVDTHGINPVIEHNSFGTVVWGNSTLQKANTLLKHANVAELMIYLTRELKPLIESELFDPNDIQTWKTIHRRVTPLLDEVQRGRGIWKYLYQGDQDIDDISQAQINQPDDIDAGRYTFHLFIAPKVGLKYLGVKVILTNSGVDFETLTA